MDNIDRFNTVEASTDEENSEKNGRERTPQTEETQIRERESNAIEEQLTRGKKIPGSSNMPDKIFLNQRYYQKFNNSKVIPNFNRDGVTSDIIEATFSNKRRQLFKNKNKLSFVLYQYVIVEMENGIDIATVTAIGDCAFNKQKTHYKDKQPTRDVLRHASPKDMQRHKGNLDETPKVVEKTKALTEKYKLEMKVTDAEWQFDRQRLTIYFTAPQRVDFRELVKELAGLFKTRIELRQISSREEAKRIGGMGSCGRPLCCASFAFERSRVTLDHARAQQLANNISKLSGYCGRLKCCLLYEYNFYVEALRKYPPLDSQLILPEGKAKILKADIFKDLVYAYIPKAKTYKTIYFDELSILADKGKILPPKEDKTNAKRFNTDDDIKELKKLEDES